MAQNYLKAPFPYFGGKAPIANMVWSALGQPRHYIEPFFGSGAVLLLRPDHQPQKHIETVNDQDGFLCNVWRSLRFSPDETARWCDWPVNHADLMARRKALLKNEANLLACLTDDDKWHDPVMAGYWIWAASCWIGAGLTRMGAMPHVSNDGMGVHALGQRHNLSDDEMAVTDPYNVNIYTWFRRLSERLRYVRVVCGDWTRVCGGNWQDKIGVVGIFMDPPYSGGIGRDEDIYHQEDTTVAAAVRQWCLERGDRPSHRIVLAGYQDEHQELLNHGWRMLPWKAQGGYAQRRRNGANQNRYREALFVSPHCLYHALF